MTMAGIKHGDATGKVDKLSTFNIPQSSVNGAFSESITHDANTSWCRLLFTYA